MTTTHQALESQMKADSRLTSMGVLSPRNTSQDDEWLALWTKASQEAIRTGLPTFVKLGDSSQPEAGQT